MRKQAMTRGGRKSGLQNRVRIIGGQWRGRKLAFPDIEGLRPTGDRIRETLFNWLAPVLPGAKCLDLFAGSGVLGLEALSRGGAACVLVERHTVAVRMLRESVAALGATSCQVEQSDALTWIRGASGQFDLVFMDPPFADEGLQAGVIVAEMLARQLLSAEAWIYLEQPREAQLPALDQFSLHREQVAGQVRYSLWRRSACRPA